MTPAEAAPPPDPLASLDPADRPIAEKLRDMLPKSDRTFSSRKERLAVEAFYQKRNYRRCGSSAAPSARAPMPRSPASMRHPPTA